MSVCVADQMSEEQFRQFQAMMCQGRPLVLENGCSVRVARFWEMCRRWDDSHERITTLFTSLVRDAQARNPANNRANWTMQAANLWRSYAREPELNTALRRMQLGVSAHLDVDEAELTAFCKWAVAHHQHHVIALHGVQLTARSGEICLPLVADDGTVTQVPWRTAIQSELFEELVQRPGSFKQCYLSAEGYRRGDPWAVPPTEGLQMQTSDWPPMLQKQASKVNRVTFGIWTSGRSTTSNNHFVLETQSKSGEFRSAGWYRKEDFGFARGCQTDNGYIQVPDLSSFLWDAPSYLVRFSFEVTDEQLEQIHHRVIALRRGGNVPYRTPDLICQQLWEKALDCKFDFSRNLWRHLAKTAYAEKGHHWFSLAPSWLSRSAAWTFNRSYRLGKQLTPRIVQRVAGVIVAPFENFVAAALGGQRVGDDVEDVTALVTPGTWYYQRMRVVFPTEALQKFEEVCELFSQQVADNPDLSVPGGERELWLASSLCERVYPYGVLEQLMLRAEARSS